VAEVAAFSAESAAGHPVTTIEGQAIDNPTSVFDAFGAVTGSARVAKTAAFLAADTAAKSEDTAYISSKAEKATFSAASFDAKRQVSQQFFMPLWAETECPTSIESAHRAFIQLLRSRSNDWSFWHAWYLAMWNGTFEDWDLAEEVAKIPNDVWEEGAEAVAEEIRKIEAKQHVTEALKTIPTVDQLAQFDRHGIGGNQPPSEIDDPVDVIPHATIIWASVDELREEVEAETPNRDRVKAAIQVIGQGLASCGKWLAGKGDLAVDTLIKWGIPAGGGAWVLANPGKIQALVEAALKWLAFL